MDTALSLMLLASLFINFMTLLLVYKRFKDEGKKKYNNEFLNNKKQIELLFKQIYFLDSKGLTSDKRIESLERILATIISTGGSNNEPFH